MGYVWGIGSIDRKFYKSRKVKTSNKKFVIDSSFNNGVERWR